MSPRRSYINIYRVSTEVAVSPLTGGRGVTVLPEEKGNMNSEVNASA